MRVAITVMLLCLATTGVLIATPPERRATPKPAVRVLVEHRTVEKRLPRRTKVKRIYVDVPAPAPAFVRASAPAPVPAPSTPARATPVRLVRAAPAPAPTSRPRPTAQTALPTDAGSLHQWEEVHHRDAPNHDQIEHQGGGGD